MDPTHLLPRAIFNKIFVSLGVLIEVSDSGVCASLNVVQHSSAVVQVKYIHGPTFVSRLCVVIVLP